MMMMIHWHTREHLMHTSKSDMSVGGGGGVVLAKFWRAPVGRAFPPPIYPPNFFRKFSNDQYDPKWGLFGRVAPGKRVFGSFLIDSERFQSDWKVI